MRTDEVPNLPVCLVCGEAMSGRESTTQWCQEMRLTTGKEGCPRKGALPNPVLARGT